ncbi:MarR family winged helix-turn-helix transcriptional regulator [Ideonella sp.]|uniref:MarR family winged helix-turn-helix transcriptional regulator n=1 Tax=Ideonella sp. TaxID=1929293 RepID=UPI0035B12591
MTRSKPIAAAKHTARADQDESVKQVLRQFRQVFNAVKTHFQKVEKRAGIGGAQLWALSVIAEHPERGVNDLARAMDIKQSTASNLVKSLVERGLVVVSRDGPDRRAVQLKVLPPGRRILAKAPGPFTGVLPGALSQLDPRTLRRIEKDLATLIEALGADTRAATTPLADM